MMRKLRLAVVITALCLPFVSLRAQIIQSPLKYALKSPGNSKGCAVIIILHGYGGEEQGMMSLAEGDLGAGKAVFSLRAPIITDSKGYCWYQMQFLPDGKFKYDYADVIKSRNLILDFILKACREFKLDSTNVTLMGFSQGAIMSYELSLYAPHKIKNVVALSGRMLDESRAHTVNEKQMSRLGYFIGHGTEDDVIKVAESEKAAGYLKTKKARVVDLKKYKFKHTITADELADIKKWLSASAK